MIESKTNISLQHTSRKNGIILWLDQMGLRFRRFCGIYVIAGVFCTLVRGCVCMMNLNLRRGLNALIAVAVVAEWIIMITGGDGMLSARGIGSLKYFTILSNLLEVFASVFWLASSFKAKSKNNGETLKYAAAASVMLTFTVVMVFLGPMFGYASMFVGPNLWFHLLIPLIAAAEFVLLSEKAMNRRDNILAVLPMLIYGVFYLGNNLINGTGEWPNTNDWYGFMLWGKPAGIAIFFLIILVTYLLGFSLRKLRDIIARKKMGGRS